MSKNVFLGEPKNLSASPKPFIGKRENETLLDKLDYVLFVFAPSEPNIRTRLDVREEYAFFNRLTHPLKIYPDASKNCSTG